MNIVPVIGAALALLTLNPQAALNEQSFEKWRDYVRPSADEMRWQEIPWRTSFWSAVQEAQRLDKPILMWAMNGHPLACT
jgi:hypothetical protein